MILKPFSHDLGISYLDFLLQNYFLLVNRTSLKKVNIKGVNKISSSINKEFTELTDNDIINRKFEDMQLSNIIISKENIPEVSDMTRSRLGSADGEAAEGLSFSGLGAVFSIEMFDVIWLEELFSDAHRSGIEIIKDTMIFGEKSHLFEKFTDNIKTYEKYLQNPSEFTLINNIRSETEKIFEEYSENPYDHFLLALIYHRPTSFHNVSEAEKEFSKSRKLSAEIENNELAALCDMMISWLAYVEKDYDKAIEISQRALDLEFFSVPEIYFNLSKFYAAKGDYVNSIKYLDEVIRGFDYLYAVKADIDDDFNKIRNELDDYFSKAKDSAKNSIMKRLNNMGIVFVSE